MKGANNSNTNGGSKGDKIGVVHADDGAGSWKSVTVRGRR